MLLRRGLCSMATRKVCIDEARRFMIDCLVAAGSNQLPARRHAELLIQADISRHYSHGFNRLELYVNDIRTGICFPNAEPEVLKETAATAWVDGRSALGSTVAHFCMQLAIRKAKEVGVGWVSVKRSNHFGMAGYWAKLAEKEGLIGMAFTNTSPLLTPTRAKQAALGTNPIAVAAPAASGDSFMLDMATTAVALGKIEMNVRKDHPLPSGWALGPDGKETSDAKLAYDTAMLMPLGGGEESSGYKGYGLSAMVEIFSGICSGSKYGHHVRPWSIADNTQLADLGHCFAAIDPKCFAPGFEERMSDCLDHWRSLPPVDPSKPVLAPGDKERLAGEATHKENVIEYVQQQIDSAAVLAKKLGVTPLKMAS